MPKNKYTATPRSLMQTVTTALTRETQCTGEIVHPETKQCKLLNIALTLCLSVYRLARTHSYININSHLTHGLSYSLKLWLLLVHSPYSACLYSEAVRHFVGCRTFVLAVDRLPQLLLLLRQRESLDSAGSSGHSETMSLLSLLRNSSIVIKCLIWNSSTSKYLRRTFCSRVGVMLMNTVLAETFAANGWMRCSDNLHTTSI